MDRKSVFVSSNDVYICSYALEYAKSMFFSVFSSFVITKPKLTMGNSNIKIKYLFFKSKYYFPTIRYNYMYSDFKVLWNFMQINLGCKQKQAIFTTSAHFQSVLKIALSCFYTQRVRNN